MQNEAYKARISRVVDHIQCHLDASLTVGQLSRIACFSEFHFNRVFKAVMGEPVYRFIKRLRLEKAAERLVSDRHLTITEVALMVGFSGSAAFAKSFKSHFGISASRWRRQFHEGFCSGTVGRYNASPKLIFSDGRPVWIFDLNGERRQITLEEMPPAALAYIRYVGPFQGDADLFDSLYERLFQWAVPRGYVDKATPRFNIYHDNPEITSRTNLRVMVAVPVPETVADSDTVGITTLSGGLYAVCPLRLSKDDFVGAWEWMVAAWLNKSGYAPDGREVFERYRGETCRNSRRIFEVDLCIPVKPV